MEIEAKEEEAQDKDNNKNDDGKDIQACEDDDRELDAQEDDNDVNSLAIEDNVPLKKKVPRSDDRFKVVPSAADLRRNTSKRVQSSTVKVTTKNMSKSSPFF